MRERLALLREAMGRDIALSTHFLDNIIDVNKYPLPEIDNLAKRIRRGDKAARDHMISANLRLVVKIAMDYKDFGLPLLDLISEGNIGLVKAVERFDPRKGGKLSTYAAWWIKQAIKRALASNGKTIRLPVHMVDRISQMRRTTHRLDAIAKRLEILAGYLIVAKYTDAWHIMNVAVDESGCAWDCVP